MSGYFGIPLRNGLPLGLGTVISLRSGASWTPLTLFLAGEQGGWYDPSDLTTMFQDSAGTTPVTAVEQPVGLWLDKRLGALSALGPELVTNGDFATDTAWSKGAGWTISGGSANANTPSATSLTQNLAVSAGKAYRIQFTLTIASGNISVFLGGNSVRANAPAGTYSLIVVAGSANTAIAFDALNAMVGTVDNVSVREVPGNHLIQPTSASRPTYSKRYNQLVSTENLASASWANTVGGTGTTPVRTAAYAAAPNGTMTATRLQVSLGGGTTTAAQSYVSQVYPITVDHTYRIWLKSNTASSYVVYVRGSNTEAAVTVTPEWQQFTVSVPSSSSNVWAVGLRGGQATPNSDSADILVWGTDARRTIHTTMGMPAYQRVTTATDYDESGFLPRLRFDGADDSMYSAASIDFSGTNKASIFVGLTRLGTTGIILETSASASANAGAFQVYTNNTNYQIIAGATISNTITPASTAAPISEIETVLANVAGPSLVNRTNGVVGTTSTSTQGTGNFGNHVLYVGRRNNATLPFNGDIFQLIVRGALTSGADLTSAEQYVAARTGVTL